MPGCEMSSDKFISCKFIPEFLLVMVQCMIAFSTMARLHVHVRFVTAATFSLNTIFICSLK